VASRREEKEQRRQARIARERAELEDQHKRRLYAIIAGVVLAGAAIVAVVVAVASSGGGGGSDTAFGFSKKAKGAQSPPPERISSLEEAAKAAKCTLKNPPIEGRTHVTKSVKYKTNPPTSGNHYPIPQTDGVYTRQPPLTHLVHTLEHGRIELEYKPTLSPKRVAQLGGFYNESPSYMVLFPNNTMPYAFAAIAWGHSAACKEFTDETFDVIRAFKKRYLGQAPESLGSQPTNF